MPIYSYRCRDCDKVMDAFRSVAKREDCPDCESCGGDTKKIIAPYSVHPDFQPYFDDNLETYVKSRQHRKKVMQEKGVSEIYGRGWR